eukprot:scaffold117830_cov32-Phaeocystis_antarctica.AAC.2
MADLSELSEGARGTRRAEIETNPDPMALTLTLTRTPSLTLTLTLTRRAEIETKLSSHLAMLQARLHWG